MTNPTGLSEALDRIAKGIGKQLELIEARVPGKYLDKGPVVSALHAHKRRAETALAARTTAPEGRADVLDIRTRAYELVELVADQNINSTDRYTHEKELNRHISRLTDLALGAEDDPEQQEWVISGSDGSEELQAAAQAQDTKRLDWIIDNATIKGGGNGFELRVWIPVDSEDVRSAIDTLI